MTGTCSLPRALSMLHALLLQGLQRAALVSDARQEVKRDWPVSGVGADGAYKDCPCAKFVGNMSLASLFADSLEIQDGDTFIIRHDKVSTWTLPLDYGTNRCSDWDALGTTHEQCSADGSRPAWCEAKWCFVNPNICQRPWAVSSILPGLSYSYQTCGDLDFFLSPNMQTWNDSHPLYAFAFGHEAQRSPTSASKFLNLFLELAALVLDEAGIPLTAIRYRPKLSNSTRRATSSTYTGCVRDIGLGHLDLCIGDIWDTAERQSFGAASFIPVLSEKMRLVGPINIDEGESLRTMLWRPFSPFSENLWGMIVAVVAVVAFSMLAVEYGRPGSDFGHDGMLLSDIVKSLYISTTRFLNAEKTFQATTKSGRLIMVGYGIFVLIAIASFTAETASFLIQEKEQTEVTSIEAALGRSATICYSVGMQRLLESRHPRMKQRGVPVDSSAFEDFVDRMSSGQCKYSVVGELWPDISWEKGDHCNFKFLGSTILDFPTGYWVRDDLRNRFNYGVAGLRARGALGEVEMNYRTLSICKEHSSRFLQASDHREAKVVSNAKIDRRLQSDATVGETQDKPAEREPMWAHHMYGTACILGFCIALAVIIRIGEMCCSGISVHDKELIRDASYEVEQALHHHTHHWTACKLRARGIVNSFSTLGMDVAKSTQFVANLEMEAKRLLNIHGVEMQTVEVIKDKMLAIHEEIADVESKTTRLMSHAHDLLEMFVDLQYKDLGGQHPEVTHEPSHVGRSAGVADEHLRPTDPEDLGRRHPEVIDEPSPFGQSHDASVAKKYVSPVDLEGSTQTVRMAYKWPMSL